MQIIFKPRVKVFIAFLTLFWAFVIYFILVISLPANIFGSAFYRFKKYSLFIEKWNFFADGIRNTRSYYLIKQNNQWVADPRLLVGTAANLFGIIRSDRLLAMKYDRLEKTIPPGSWLILKDYEFLNFDLNSPRTPSVNIHTVKIAGIDLPGDFIIIKKDIVPWEKRNDENKMGTPVKIIRVHNSF